MALTLLDDFSDNSLDTAIWNTVGSGAVEQNQRMEIDGTNAWDANGIIGKSQAISRVVGDQVTFKMYGPNADHFSGGISDSTTALHVLGTDTNDNCMVYFHAAGDIRVITNGANTDTTYNWATATWYTLTIEFKAVSGFKVYIDGGAFTNQLIWDSTGNAAATYYFQFNIYTNNVGAYFDDVYYTESGTSIPVFMHHYKQMQGA